jgi:hypothetical protein
VACHFHLSIYAAKQAQSHDLCADFQVAFPSPNFLLSGNSKSVRCHPTSCPAPLL